MHLALPMFKIRLSILHQRPLINHPIHKGGVELAVIKTTADLEATDFVLIRLFPNPQLPKKENTHAPQF